MDSDAKAYQELRFELTRLATALVGPSEAEDVVADVVTRVLERCRGGLARLKDPRSHMVMLGVRPNRKMVTEPRTDGEHVCG